jgi:hypothetical protein
MEKIVELFAESISDKDIWWNKPSNFIGACTVAYGKDNINDIICPHSFGEGAE